MDGAHEQVNTQRAHERDVDAGVWPSLPLRESEQTNKQMPSSKQMPTQAQPRCRLCKLTSATSDEVSVQARTAEPTPASGRADVCKRGGCCMWPFAPLLRDNEHNPAGELVYTTSEEGRRVRKRGAVLTVPLTTWAGEVDANHAMLRAGHLLSHPSTSLHMPHRTYPPICLH
jgi:hypothetical protein